MKPEKSLLILGAGESGTGAALLGKKQGWQVFVSDGGSLQAAHRQELEENDIRFEEGGHGFEDLSAYGLVVKSPGIPEKAAVVQRIRQAGIPVVSEIEFAFRYKGSSQIIAITGSNGKSTTTKLVYHLLRTGNLDVSLVGNIGISLARQIATRPTAWYALEVSSFQLEDIETFRPDIAILLNITPDHLDRYDYQMEKYAAAKMRLAENQTAADVLYLNADDAGISAALLLLRGNPECQYFSLEAQADRQLSGWAAEDHLHLNLPAGQLDLPVSELSVQGRHNQYNALAAGLAAGRAGVSPQAIRSGLASFEGLEHRMEECGSFLGVRYVNDSKATNVDSVWYALDSFRQPVVLILGGQDKGNDYRQLLPLVQEKVKAIVCMGMDNAPIHQAFDGLRIPVVDTTSATEAVAAAARLSNEGDAVLLSPACASFDLFKNYEDRGRQFKAAVRKHFSTLSKIPA